MTPVLRKVGKKQASKIEVVQGNYIILRRFMIMLAISLDESHVFKLEQSFCAFLRSEKIGYYYNFYLVIDV